MHVRRVRSAEDVEQLRKLRNSCRKTMTEHTAVITKKQQQKWWDAAPRRAWLLVTESGDALGFGLVTRRERKGQRFNFVTVGLKPSERGKGLGTLLFRTLRPAIAEIRPDNAASIRACEKAGYQRMLVGEDEEIVRMA